MAKNQTVSESMELETGVSLDTYINNNRASIGIEAKDISVNVWLTLEELQDFADMLNKVLEENRA